MAEMQRRLPEAVRERVAAETQAGRSAQEIATDLGITARTVVRIRRERGLAQPLRIVPWTEETRKAVAALIEQGLSHTEIADTLHVSRNAIGKHFPGTAWTNQECFTFAASVSAISRRSRKRTGRYLGAK